VVGSVIAAVTFTRGNPEANAVEQRHLGSARGG